MPIKSFITRTIICPVCERKFSGRDLKRVKKLSDLHILKSHEGIQIEETTTMQFTNQIHTPGGIKRMTDTELKAINNKDYDHAKMETIIEHMSDKELTNMYERMLLS